MDDKININNDNVSEYVTKRTVTVNGGVWDGEKLPVIKVILASLFFSLMLPFISGLGYLLVELPRLTHSNVEYFDSFSQFWIKIIFTISIVVSPIFFFAFLIVVINDFQTNKTHRAQRIVTLLIIYGILFVVIFFQTSSLFIPMVIGAVIRYSLICLFILLSVSFSVYWFKKRVNVFYKKSEISYIDKMIKKVKIWIVPLLGLLAAISYGTASFRTEARLAFYGAISPFFILLIIPYVYLVFYYLVGEFLELYYINKFPEAIRMETDFTKEEWYGPKYQKSKEVMQKIKEFEEYIEN